MCTPWNIILLVQLTLKNNSGKERIQVLCRQSGQLYSLIALGELNELHMGRYSGMWEVFANLSYYQ